MITKKTIKESICKEFNLPNNELNWYATRYYNFIKVKCQVKANTFIIDDVAIMRWEKGEYKVKLHDHVDKIILTPLLLNN
jgi:hypothetical protein